MQSPCDQGTSAKHAAGRESFQALAADVGLGKIGIIMGYEVSRLARNQQFPVVPKSVNPGGKWPLAPAISDNRRLFGSC